MRTLELHLAGGLRDFCARPSFLSTSEGPGWSRARCWGACLLLATVSAVCDFSNTNYPLMKFDEGTYAEVARSMMRSGDWVVPRVRGRPYLAKPPLTYWMMAGCFKVFGVHDWAARVAPEAATLAAVLALFWLGRHQL